MATHFALADKASPTSPTKNWKIMHIELKTDVSDPYKTLLRQFLLRMLSGLMWLAWIIVVAVVIFHGANKKNSWTPALVALCVELIVTILYYLILRYVWPNVGYSQTGDKSGSKAFRKSIGIFLLASGIGICVVFYLMAHI